MHGLPLNLNGIRLKTTFPADTRRNPYNVCRPPRSPLPLPPPCPALDSRSYFHLTRFPRPTEPGISVKSPAFFVYRFSNGSPARDIVSTSRFEFRFRHRLAPLPLPLFYDLHVYPRYWPRRLPVTTCIPHFSHFPVFLRPFREIVFT